MNGLEEVRIPARLVFVSEEGEYGATVCPRLCLIESATLSSIYPLPVIRCYERQEAAKMNQLRSRFF